MISQDDSGVVAVIIGISPLWQPGAARGAERNIQSTSRSTWHIRIHKQLIYDQHSRLGKTAMDAFKMEAQIHHWRSSTPQQGRALRASFAASARRARATISEQGQAYLARHGTTWHDMARHGTTVGIVQWAHPMGQRHQIHWNEDIKNH